MATQPWTTANIADLKGKTAIVTGANSGLGFEVGRELARKGATVVLASRDTTKGERAAAQIRQELPEANLEVMVLDLADLESVRRFAREFSERYSQLHMLCNNAGVMAIPYRQTRDGFEMQFGTNHLGHFALTGLLLPVILKAREARVVTTSSMLHRSGQINFEDLAGKNSYKPGTAYSQSKLANLLFAYELERKFQAIKAEAISLAAHPGYAATNLQQTGPLMEGSAFKATVMNLSNRLFAQSAAMGALPILYAATSPEARGGDYIGPGGLAQMRGYPIKARSNEISYNPEVASRLWKVSEELTGVHYEQLTYIQS